MSSTECIDPSGKKRWVPLENNPDTMSHLAKRLGLSPEIGFHDVYSITDPDLLAIIPRPAHALIFIAPGEVFYKARGEEKKTIPVYEGSGPDEPVMWFKQTIGNTCGFMALLHGISNGGAKKYIKADSILDHILKAAEPLKTEERADVLYNSKELETEYHETAQRGDSAPPPAADHPGLHFISFVKGDDGNLWELNGGMNGPQNRGALEPDQDVLSERALDLGPRSFLEAAKEAGIGDARFSIVALAPAFD